MTERPVVHSTLVLERSYEASPMRVFAAWADPEAKARWFACHAEYTLDFRVGGGEFTRGGEEGGPVFTTNVTFHDIVPERRILYTYALHRDGVRTTVALVTVEFEGKGGGTRLIVTEQGAHLDTDDVPTHLEEGMREGLERLAAELQEMATVGVGGQLADRSASTSGGPTTG